MVILTSPEEGEKTKIIYRVITSICKTDGAEGVIVYGVEAKRSGDSTKIEDISADKREAEQLILRLIRGNVTPDQLMYIVEDYLIERST